MSFSPMSISLCSGQLPNPYQENSQMPMCRPRSVPLCDGALAVLAAATGVRYPGRLDVHRPCAHAVLRGRRAPAGGRPRSGTASLPHRRAALPACFIRVLSTFRAGHIALCQTTMLSVCLLAEANEDHAGRHTARRGRGCTSAAVHASCSQPLAEAAECSAWILSREHLAIAILLASLAAR